MVKLADNLIRKLDALVEQYADYQQQLLEPAVLSDHRAVATISRKRKALEPIVTEYQRLREIQSQIEELEQILDANDDPELVELARAELPTARERADSLSDAVMRRLVTADEVSVGSVIVELRAGVGGDEAAIWTGDLVQMYEKYAQQRGWLVETLDSSPAEMGGYKQAILRIEGDGVWSNLGYEGGTHQVKRVPETETQGRIHTSTATVAVLPEPEEVEVDLDRSDVKEMITTSQGPGGQNVNKVATAVHLIHEPSGIEVRMQDTKSQAQNREKAWALLRARLYERQAAEAAEQRAEERLKMIGTASRAEKIRTYRYKDNLVVDHRIGESFNLSDIMAGNLQPMIDLLVEHDTAQRLAGL